MAATDVELLSLHGVRLLGFATPARVAARFGLPEATVEEELLDQEAYGRTTWTTFGETEGWSLTPSGKAYGERLLAGQLDRKRRPAIESAYEVFLPLNAELRDAVSRWQLRPTSDDPAAENDHRDAVWDAEVLSDLREISRALVPLLAGVVRVLPRFAGYDTRFARALDRAAEGDREWVDGVGIDSCHTVWFELHEDFLATLGLAR